jgi:hypothetical protein
MVEFYIEHPGVRAQTMYSTDPDGLGNRDGVSLDGHSSLKQYIRYS